ncbi:DnaB-like helicase C-terminal domain-containing protein [Caballeronia sp. LZ034LL]|uniref:DnaB-like helicase C-terminal domain-containing protein n=1 Tax=Caballeronia sp. LZ034LL TaxID=3038567 RepID=UPI003857843C
MKGEAYGVPTGINALDQIIKALQTGRVYTLAGRTLMRKSALALSIAHNIVKTKKKGLYFSLEMGGQELTARARRLQPWRHQEHRERFPHPGFAARPGRSRRRQPRKQTARSKHSASARSTRRPKPK